MTSRDVVLRRRSRRRQQARDEPHYGRRGLTTVALLAAIGLFIAVAAMASAVSMGLQRYNAIADTVVPAEELISEMSMGGARVYDRNGTLLYEFVDEYEGLRRPVALNQIADWVKLATIATEDADFYENNGVNTRGLARAAMENFTPFLTGGDDFLEGTGGSSITQQLAKNVYIPRELRTERSIQRKIEETVIALELTEQYSKDQILEWYLNSITYGSIYVGIETAAEGYFGKHASELTLAEASLLAGIPQSPALYDPFSPRNFDAATGQLAMGGLTKARQGQVLELMAQQGFITREEAEIAWREPLNFRERRYDIEAPHFVLNRVADEIRARFGDRALYDRGLEITTTIDLELNYIAEEILDRNITEYGEVHNLHNGAFLATDPNTGEILVYVGSRDYFRADIEGRNDNITARNSPGSTLKPFTYMGTFMKGWGTGAAILDTPLTLVDDLGNEFTPRNPGTGFQGPVPVAEALGNSLNIPAIKAMQFVGVDETIDLYKQLGFTTLDNPGGYGPALTTGGGEVTLMDQVIAYSVLASGGQMRGQEAVATRDLADDDRDMEPVALLRVEDAVGEVLYEFEGPAEQRIVDEEFTYLVSNILSDGQNTCLTFGTCDALDLSNGYPAAAKTGTSEPFDQEGMIGETWTLGYTPDLVAGIWAGNSDNDPLHDILSTTVAFRAWEEFMVAAIDHLGLEERDFERPSGVVEEQVCWPSGLLPSSQCPLTNRYSSLYAEQVIPNDPGDVPHMYDSWWQNGRLVFPEDEVREWSGMQQWAAQYGVNVTGGQPNAGQMPSAPMTITSPSPGQMVSGEISIQGAARSDNFVRYALEWGEGSNPSSWNRIGVSDSPVSGGLLMRWDTTEASNGQVTIRLLVQDRFAGVQAVTVPISVVNSGDSGSPSSDDDSDSGSGSSDDDDDDDATPTPTPTGTPQQQLPLQAEIAGLGAGSVASGTITLSGVATSPTMTGYVLQVGQGSSPSDWFTFAEGDEPVEGGALGTWDTSSAPDGAYTFRVQVMNGSVVETQYWVTVLVQND